MGKYTKIFATHSEYEEFINHGIEYYPNVSLCKDNNDLHVNDNSSPEPPTPPTPTHDYSQDYLTFVILNASSSSASITTECPGYVEFSKDSGKTWNTEVTGLTAGDKILVKGNIKDYSGGGSGSGSGSGSGNGSVSSSSGKFYVLNGVDRFNLEGNIMSIYDSENFKTRTTFEEGKASPFSGFCASSNVVSAENLVLPATTLVNNCYYAMFNGCTSLTTAPELPATTLVQNCYAGMFGGCTSLTTAPELPVTTLARDCYESMFYGCTNLNYIKCLATDISAGYCTYNWVQGVAASGTFVKNATMSNWTRGVNGIPMNWTVESEGGSGSGSGSGSGN